MILGLIFAAIFVIIGVNLMPGINTTLATITTPTYSTGVTGMTGVILIVFAAIKRKRIVASRSNPSRITGLIRGNLSPSGYGNPELNLKHCFSKCVETIYPAPHVGDEIVQPHLKNWDMLGSFRHREEHGGFCLVPTWGVAEKLI